MNLSKDEISNLHRIKESIVAVGLVDENETQKAIFGTGFFINATGYALTARHVLRECIKKKNQAENVGDDDDDDDIYPLSIISYTLGIFIIEYSSGSSDSLYKSKDLIITMITSDFDKSPTVGYVRAADVEHVFDISNKSNSLPPALPNPFADEQTINSTLTLVISEAIDSAQSIGFTVVAIQCNFGMNIMDWKCKDHGIYG